MNTPELFFIQLKKQMGKTGISAFMATLVMGIITHMPILVSDIPNHDGLASIYFDQNMITSGRWFLSVACGISSYYSVPWVIGVLAIIYIAITSAILVKLLKIKSTLAAGVIGAMMVTFPALASNFAYVFTLDGYMLGLLFAVLAVRFVEATKTGFVWGAIFLALSMGIYQAYLPVAMLLCLYMVLVEFAGNDTTKVKIKSGLKYLYMGGVGVALYYLVLKMLLAIEGKALDTYQGIDSMSGFSISNPLELIKQIYVDFAAFSAKGNVLFNNVFALTAWIILGFVFLYCLFRNIVKKKHYRSLWFYLLAIFTIVVIPVLTNAILVVSTGVTYHVLMRYQWVLFGILAVAYIDNYRENPEAPEEKISLRRAIFSWISLAAAIVIVFNFILTDNIGYSNLNKKYEKTYAYCLRLADRIEQTEGYYQGIPIYMIGVVGNDPFPVTDVTENVTDHLIGLNGDFLLYTGENYELFFKHYMGITFNFLRPGEANYYYEDWYVEMPSFPAKDSVKVVDGVLVIKTENSDRSKAE